MTLTWRATGGAEVLRTARVALVALTGLATLSAAACNHSSTASGGNAVRERWYRPQRGESSARPAIAGGLAYFGTGDGRVVARLMATGEERWTATVSSAGAAVRGANLIARAGVVVVAVAAHTVGLDAATGRELWRYRAPLDTVGNGTEALPGSVVKTRIDANDDVVFIPAWGASVGAVSVRDGTVRWTWQPGRASSDTASSGIFRSGSMGIRVSGDVVFATVWHFLDRQGLRAEAWLVALDAATGRELWRYVQPSYTGGVMVQGAPAVHGELVIFATVGGRVTAVDRTSGEVAWTFSSPQIQFATVSQVELVNGVGYADGGDERLYALDASTGEVLWSASTLSATQDLLVTTRRVYHVNGGTIRVLDRRTGQIIATTGVRDVAHAVESPLAFADGSVFVNVTTAAWSFDEP